MQLPTLHPDLIIEILTWSPVNSLLRFRCVSKWFKNLISSPNFVKAHLRSMKALSRTKPNQIERIVRRRSLCMISYPLCSFYDDDQVESVLLDHLPALPFKHEVVGACDGMLCIVVHLGIAYDDQYARSRWSEVILWNPSIRLWCKLPCFDNHRSSWYMVFGFGYDSRSDDYKVVKVCVDRDGVKTIVEVCSLRSKQWRKIENFKYGVPGMDWGKLVAGCVHWPNQPVDVGHRRNYESRDFIVSLDLSTEINNKVMLPDLENEIQFWKVCTINDCLCFFSMNEDSSLELWMMKEYGVRESWTKLLRTDWTFGRPLYMLDSDRVLFERPFPFMIFNVKDGSCRVASSRSENSYPEYSGYPEEFHIYMETLVCPNTEY